MTHKPRPRPDTPHYMTEDRVELQRQGQVPILPRNRVN